MPPDEPADHHDDERNEDSGSCHARITSCAAPAPATVAHASGTPG
jgi:hypothetical protein